VTTRRGVAQAVPDAVSQQLLSSRPSANPRQRSRLMVNGGAWSMLRELGGVTLWEVVPVRVALEVLGRLTISLPVGAGGTPAWSLVACPVNI